MAPKTETTQVETSAAVPAQRDPKVAHDLARLALLRNAGPSYDTGHPNGPALAEAQRTQHEMLAPVIAAGHVEPENVLPGMEQTAPQVQGTEVPEQPQAPVEQGPNAG